MCGISGFFDSNNGYSADESVAIVTRMSDAIAHRGPDDSGSWVDSSLGVALGHRRLSIIDVSVEGRQPMVSPSGRFVIVFNGEIYNHLEIRSDLEASGDAPAWRGHSDTEILLAACDSWGIESALSRANGMFALALLDRTELTLTLARDRMGEKPLYYGWQRDVFLFGSELKALRAHPKFMNRLDPRALPGYFRFGYVPAPLSIYAGISKLQPGYMFRVPLRGGPRPSTPEAYWVLPLPKERDQLDAAEAAERLEHLLRDAIKMRMHSDVALGAFLSGGIDSSTVVALMQSQSGKRVCTYSIGFREQLFDETPNARLIAKVLGTDHTELYVTPGDALRVVPILPDIYDEPFADSSQIPTYLLAKLTRKHVTVALSGDGGDELFGGYVRYIQGDAVLRLQRFAPLSMRRALGRMLTTVVAPAWDRFGSTILRSFGTAVTGDRLLKLAEVVGLDGVREVYGRLVSQWPDPAEIVRACHVTQTLLDDEAIASRIPLPISWMMYMDQLTYLPDDILVKVDRASMAVALEARVPLLDHRLVEFASSLPVNLKLVKRTGKWLLRKVLYKYVDRRLVDRPKQGFGIPVAEWLRGPLREWADELLSEPMLGSSGLLNIAPIRRAWVSHLSRRRNYHYPLWVVLMFQAWYARARPVT